MKVGVATPAVLCIRLRGEACGSRLGPVPMEDAQNHRLAFLLQPFNIVTNLRRILPGLQVAGYRV